MVVQPGYPHVDEYGIRRDGPWPTARTLDERIRDTKQMLREIQPRHMHVATALPDPKVTRPQRLNPYAFLWLEPRPEDDPDKRKTGNLLFSTTRNSMAVRHIEANPYVEASIGPTLDIVRVSGWVRVLGRAKDPDTLDPWFVNAFAAATGFNPAAATALIYVWLLYEIDVIEASRLPHEEVGRQIATGGQWELY